MLPKIQYNLVIIHTPDKQDISDFLTIRNMMLGKAPDIAVWVLTAGQRVTTEFVQTLSKLPTLIFSPMPDNIPSVFPGRRLTATAKTKLEQIKILQESGFAVPEHRVLVPGIRLEQKEWGELVIVKPNGGQRGQGVRLIRTANVAYRNPNTWGRDDPRFGKDLIVQKWIDTGEFPESIRVMTVLGKVVCAYKVISFHRSNPDLAVIIPDGIPIASNDEYRLELTYDHDVVELASRIHNTLNFTSVMGIDIIRDQHTGHLYVLELNPGGWTWHLSSALGKEGARKNSVDRYGQFNALDIIANALIEKTRSLAE